MNETINEGVKVWALFDLPNSGPKIFPFAMTWRRRLVKFEKLVFSSTKRVGRSRIVNLVCQSDSANFELEYNTENFSWRIKRVMEKDG